MLLYYASGRIAYNNTSGVRHESLCSYIWPSIYSYIPTPAAEPIIIDLVSARIAYAPIFGLRPVSHMLLYSASGRVPYNNRFRVRPHSLCSFIWLSAV